MENGEIRTATGCSVRHYSPSYKKKSIILLTRGSVIHHKELFISPICKSVGTRILLWNLCEEDGDIYDVDDTSANVANKR